MSAWQQLLTKTEPKGAVYIHLENSPKKARAPIG